jgi:hypothetical protein
MTVELELPPELQARLTAEASQSGLPLSEYLLRLLAGGRETEPLGSGADLVAYWRQEGLVGTRRDVQNSQQHARSLREQAERRERP